MSPPRGEMEGDLATMGRGWTYEEIAELIVERLEAEGILPTAGCRVPWPAFLRLSNLVHERFELSGTTVTPMMRRLLFALGHAARPSRIVGAGTFVGYAFAWLLRDRTDREAAPFCDLGVAIDIDAASTAVATKNLSLLGHGTRVRALRSDAPAVLATSNRPIDLLYVDVDDPTRGKAAYADVLRASRRSLRPGAIVLAHDPCVARFHEDFRRYHSAVAELGLEGPWVLPVDACGVSIAHVPV